MAIQTTVTSAKAWAPDVYTFAAADVVPDALILQCSTVAGSVDGDSPAVRVAYVVDDEAEHVPEGQTIIESGPDLDEVLVHTAKWSKLVRLSNEQWQQTNTAGQVSASVSRAITFAADAAFVAHVAPVGPAVAPSAGLINVAGIIEGDEVDGNLDPVVDLVAQIQSNRGTPSIILTDPLGWAELRKIRVGSGYNQSLLGAGTTDAQQLLLSLPVIVNASVPSYTGVVIDRAAVVSAVGQVKVANSEHAAFAQDAVLLRATWRTGHAVVRPDRIGTFTIATDGS